MDQMPRWLMVILVILVAVCCCLIVFAIGVVTYSNWKAETPESKPEVDTVTPFVLVNPTAVITPTTLPTESPQPTLKVDDNPDLDGTIKTLVEAQVPINDLRDLAIRLEGKSNIPETVPDPNAPYQVGARRKFWILNSDTNDFSQIDATMQYTNEHMYLWVEDGIRYDADDAKALIDEFSSKMYPTNRQFFGSEWSPGIDGDPKIYLIFTTKLGSNIAGQFGPPDEFPPAASEYSNAIEGFMVAESQDFSRIYTYGVLAHEFQHMIHWYQDRNEESWLNEGFSELAVYLNGYGSGDKAFLYAWEPDTMLTDWPSDSYSQNVHYGVAFMFVKYFLDRFGDTATQALVEDKNNGLSSLDEVLFSLGINDSQTGEGIGADDIFADWAAANYLQNESVGDGRYAYKDYNDAPSFVDTEVVYDCPVDWQSRNVAQYGVDYIRVSCRGAYSLSFEGSTQVGVLPEDAQSGKFAFWTNKGDESDMTLTQTFDFSSIEGPIEITYSVWYDLETDYDYVYLEASEDGARWEILTTPSCTTEDPSGNSYGCGYNAQTDGWIEERIDLSQFAGKIVQLRFEYITDAAVNGEGLLLDDVSIPAIQYSTDFESDNGGWDAAGFVRIENQLPQTFEVTIIHEGFRPVVERLQLSNNQTIEVPLQMENDIILIVGGTTRFTRQKAEYRFKLDQ